MGKTRAHCVMYIILMIRVTFRVRVRPARFYHPYLTGIPSGTPTAANNTLPPAGL